MNFWDWTQGQYIIQPIFFALMIIGCIFFYFYYKKHPDKNKMTPFVFAYCTMLIGEILKQLLNLFNHPINYDWFPFSVCASCIIWYGCAVFGKEGSRLQQFGYSSSVSIGFILLLLMIFAPNEIYQVRDDGNFFISFSSFWSVYYHMAMIFCLLWLLVSRPCELKWKNLIAIVIAATIWSSIIGILAHQLDTNFMDMLHGHPLDFMFPVDPYTWAYTWCSVFSQVICVSIGFVAMKLLVKDVFPLITTKVGRFLYWFIGRPIKTFFNTINLRIQSRQEARANIQTNSNIINERKIEKYKAIKERYQGKQFAPKHTFLHLYIVSLKHIVVSAFTWVALFLTLIVAVGALLIFPVITPVGLSGYYSSTQWIIMSMPFVIAIVPISSSIIGDASANLSERIYALSKSVSREKFLGSKILSTLTISLLNWVMVYVILVIIKATNSSGENACTIFTDQNSQALTILMLITLCVFGSMGGLLLKYITKNRIGIVLVLGIVLVYVICYVTIGNLSVEENNDNIFWFVNKAPLCVFIPLSAITIGLGSAHFMINKVDV